MMVNTIDYYTVLHERDTAAERYSWAAYHLFVFLSSLFGDSLILIASFKDGIKVNKSMLRIIQHIAIADLGFSIVHVLPTIISLIANSWVLGATLCDARVYLGFMFHAAGIALIPFLSTFKLLILNNTGHAANTSKSTKVVDVVCVLLWVFSAILPVLLSVLNEDEIHFDRRIYVCGYHFKSSVWKIVLPILSVLYLFLPNITIIATTIPTLKYILTARKCAKRVGGTVPWHGALTVVLTGMVYLVANLPYFIYYIRASFIKDRNDMFELYLCRISYFVSMINIMSNFFIYALTIPSFRRFVLLNLNSVLCKTLGRSISYNSESQHKGSEAITVNDTLV